MEIKTSKMIKYYTPEIEEFHVGFEFEFRKRLRQGICAYVEETHDYVKYWTSWKFCDSPEDKELMSSFEKLDNYYLAPNTIREIESFIKDKAMRVKHLDRKDIESFEFQHLGSLWFKDKYDQYRIRKWSTNEVDIYKWHLDEDDRILIFRGVIKNKSILKQLLILTIHKFKINENSSKPTC